ncbi:MAG: glycosyltransferase [Dissulfurispiraceae bacterium]|jgi:glycosyltransferase involved in cell wall biosynthesis
MIAEHPTLSIIVPCYNHETFIVECLNQIRAQGFDDYEVIVLDDHSSDRTAAVVTEFIRKTGDQRFRFFQNEANLGSTRNFNKGLNLALGYYTCFVSGDDFWDTDFIATVMSVILEGRLDFAFCRTAIINASGKEIGLIPAGQPVFHNSNEIFIAMLNGNIIAGHSIIFRTAALQQSGYFDDSFVYLSDWEFFIRLCRDSRGAFVNRKLAFYRIHGSNMGLKQFKDDTFDEIRNIMERYVFDKKHSIPSREKIFHVNILNFAASCLYNYNYPLAMRALKYGKMRIGLRFFLDLKIVFCYALAILRSNNLIDLIAWLRGRKTAHF